MKTWMTGAVAAALAIALFAFAPAGVTHATEAEFCGNDFVSVPDSGESFDFGASCEAHDECYAQYAGTNERNRLACDRAFLADMNASCDEMWARWSGDWLRCRSVASIYYVGVRLGGWLFF
jgi:hypothetical protein